MLQNYSKKMLFISKNSIKFEKELVSNIPSIFKRHMKTRSSRVNNAHETRLKHVEYEGNTRLKHVEYEGNTRLKHVEYRFKTFRLKRSLKRSVSNTPFKTKFKMTVLNTPFKTKFKMTV